ncbi:MAG: SusC/RagA family TonB-linked outer membrane protein [Dysgonamonadaceae bacterium]|jgi:TonB-linked SusC/RagA family outer membrane protein|nr:SusC/RagA family TonB-linked outer membrane protein [Dysgonamonadaceae bacterium]
MRKIILLLFVGCFCTTVFAQKTVTGTVRDAADFSTLPGVSVLVKGTQRGTVTDIDGKYSITLQQNDKDLVFSFIGMKSQTISVGNKTVIDVTMSTDENVLGEVVVSALGIKRENRSLTVAQQRVNAETLAEVRDQNIVSSLSGKIAGVQVTPPGSATGSARIVIRGNSSFTGDNQPIFIVDGMVIDNTDGSRDVRAQGNKLDLGNGASDLNADDIETIDVLKGPNAAALYGSRAANGAIIITTKKGKEGHLRLSVGTNAQFRYISQWPDYENAFGLGHVVKFVQNQQQLATTDEEGNLYPYPGMPDMRIIGSGARSAGGPHLGQPYIGLDGAIRSYSPQPDNVYDFYQTAHVYTTNVAVEGGTKDDNYRISFTNVNSNDVVETQNLVNKNTVTLRFYNTLIKNLTLDSKVSYMNDRTQNRRYANGGAYNPTSMFIYLPRTLSLEELRHYKDESGNELANLSDAHNPYWSIYETSNMDDRTRVLGNFELAYQVLPYLRFVLRYGKDFAFTRGNEYRNKGASGSDDNKGYYRDFMSTVSNDTYEGMAVLDHRFGNVSLVAIAGATRYDYRDYNNWTSIPSLKQAGFAHITNSDDFPSSDEYLGKKRTNSIYGSASFGFKDWAYLDVTARNDWSSTLPIKNNSYFYPSYGISLIPSDMLGIPSRIFYGKLRGSWAQVGNDTYPYRIYTTYDLDNIYNNYKYASFMNTLPNIDLRPEITTSWEGGADMRFFNGRLMVDFTYYYSETADQIISAKMAPSSGYSERMYNAGSIRNQGIELSVRAVPIEMKSFDWEIVANLTKNNSLVLSMIEGVTELEIGGNRGMSNVIAVGYPYGILKGTDWLKDKQGRKLVNQSTGEPERKLNAYFQDVNPDYMLGISNHFRFKAFDLYALIDIKKGGYMFSATRGQGIRNAMFAGDEADRESYWYRQYIMGDGGDAANMWGGVYMDDIYYYNDAVYDDDMNTYQIEQNAAGDWVKSEDENGNWIPDPDYTPEKCERYFLPQNVGYYADWCGSLASYEASFVKLRELSVGYNLPKKLVSKIGMSSARISAVGRNLWVIYQKTPKGLDPEASINAGNAQGLEYGALPPSTTFGFDIKLTF